MLNLDLGQRIGYNQQEISEKEKTFPLHVYSETDPLRTVALWGPPGPEVVLAQLLPPEENLFYSRFNVQGAREEYTRLLKFLREKGVNVVIVQDLLLSSDFTQLPDHEMIPSFLKELNADLKKRGMELYKRYGVGDLGILDLIPELVQEDVERLGEFPAIALNWLLSLRRLCPSGNIFYGRDQSNILGDKLVWSNMRWPIRKPEVGIYKMAFQSLIPENRHHRVRGRESYLEGGDGIMLDGNCYLGVGGRTTLAGAMEVYNGIKEDLSRKGKHMFLVVDEKAEHRAHHQQYPGEEQAAMHLDTFCMPLGDGTKVLCCAEVAKDRTVMFIRDDGGHIEVKPKGSFLDFLHKMGIDILDIPREEQLRYATNFLNLDEKTVVVPFSDNTTAIAHLEKENITTLPVEMTELGGGYGAIHCMTTALDRH